MWIRRETRSESKLEDGNKTCGSEENGVCGETRGPGGSEFKAEALISFRCGCVVGKTHGFASVFSHHLTDAVFDAHRLTPVCLRLEAVVTVKD